MKYLIYTTCLVLLYSCMCTPSADSVRIDGLYSENDTIFTKGNMPSLHLTIKPKLKYTEGKKKHCLTYNKVKASDINLNSIVPSSIKMVCDKSLGSTQAGQPINGVELIENSSIFAIIDGNDLTINQTYEFKVTCTTTDNLKLEQIQKITVRP